MPIEERKKGEEGYDEQSGRNMCISRAASPPINVSPRNVHPRREKERERELSVRIDFQAGK